MILVRTCFYPIHVSSADLYFYAVPIEAMSQKSKAALQRYLTKLDKGDSTVADDYEVDPRYSS